VYRSVTVTTGTTTTSVSVAVVTVEPRQEPGLPGEGERRGLIGRLDVATGPGEPEIYFLSRLDGEEEWALDAHFAANGTPRFSHGFGDRTVRKHTLAPELTALLDGEARSLDLTPPSEADT
jgi:hypothetical protein